MKLLVTIWMVSNIAFFTKVQNGFLTWGAYLSLSFAYPVIDCVISNFITDFQQLCCSVRDICCCYFSKTSMIYISNTSEIPVNPTCVLLQSNSVDGTDDMLCLLIDPNKNGKLATTICCNDDLSCKSWCFNRGDQLLPYFYYIRKYLDAGLSEPCYFDLGLNDEISWGLFSQQIYTLLLPFWCPSIEQALGYYSCQ